jgi:hypothetical protein
MTLPQAPKGLIMAEGDYECGGELSARFAYFALSLPISPPNPLPLTPATRLPVVLVRTDMAWPLRQALPLISTAT